MIITAHIAVLIFIITMVALCLGWVCVLDTWSDLLTETTANIERKTAGNMAVLYFFLMRFHVVHQDGSDPNFSSITQRFSSECQPVPRGPNARRKAPSTGQSWARSTDGPLHALPFSALKQFTGKPKKSGINKDKTHPSAHTD